MDPGDQSLLRQEESRDLPTAWLGAGNRELFPQPRESVGEVGHTNASPHRPHYAKCKLICHCVIAH